MSTIKGDPESIAKNVPAPELPEPKPGDKDYIGFDNDIPHVYYYIGLKRWKLRKLGFNKTKEITKKVQDYDTIVIDIAEKGFEASLLLEKREAIKLSSDEDKRLGDLQIELQKNKVKRDNLRSSLISEIVPTVLVEQDDKPFDMKHFDDSEISLTKWLIVSGHLVSFLEVSL